MKIQYNFKTSHREENTHLNLFTQYEQGNIRKRMMLKCSFLHRSYHLLIAQFLLYYFCFGMICQAKAWDSPPVLPIKRVQRILVHVPMEILNQLTFHDRWTRETKIITLTCKTTGGRNHRLYLHSSTRGCKGVVCSRYTSKAGLAFWVQTLITQPTFMRPTTSVNS